MTDWIKNNIWAISISLITIVSTYAIYGYRITQLEARAQELETDIEVIHEITTNLAVIKEKTENIEADIKEMKEDLKAISNFIP